MTIFDIFEKEHQFIKSTFDGYVKEAIAQGNWNTLYDFCFNKIECNHHKKEEEFLFDKVRNNPKIQAGGPMCTMYFDGHILQPSLPIANALVIEIKGSPSQLDVPTELKVDQENKSPLCIPEEDHFSGQVLLEEIRLLLPQERNTETLNQIRKYFDLYYYIQRRHFDREENCFFRMCAELIPQHTQVELYNQMVAKYSLVSST